MHTLSAIVLAGGQSSRMGQDKAFIQVDGLPLLQRTCEVALQCTSSVVVVTFKPDKYRAIVPTQCHLLQEQPWADESMPHGALIGFAQGLGEIKTPWVLLLACDLPYLQASTLKEWMQQLPADNSKLALLPRSDKGWEPLCGFYQTSCRTRLIPFLQQGGRSFQRWLAQVPVKAISLSSIPQIALQEQKMLFNCNTPLDLAQLEYPQC